ncbi:MAG TPA: response regulator transcription factor [Aggregatilineales bacterium]|nr:response regulator transcription factor [Aggregatilineales bacterium]
MDTSPEYPPPAHDPRYASQVSAAARHFAHSSRRYPVSVVSNSQLLREGLIPLLEKHLPIDFIACFGGQFTDLAENAEIDWDATNPPDHVVLVDCGLGRETTLSWTRFWRQRLPAAHVIIMELADDPDTILACIEAGAGGYTLQGASSTDVAEAIHCISSGQAHCSPKVTAHLFARLASRTHVTAPEMLLSPLTRRELEVLYLVAKGYSNKQISERLVIEVRTVKHHIHNVLQKLNAKRRIDAATIAYRAGWLSETELARVGGGF